MRSEKSRLAFVTCSNRCGVIARKQSLLALAFLVVGLTSNAAAQASMPNISGSQATAARRPAPLPRAGLLPSFLGIRVLKTANAGTLNWTAQLPADCEDCRLVINDYAAGQNSKEFYFHALVPPGRGLGRFLVKVDPSKVRGVIVSYTDTQMGKHGYASDRARVIGLARVDYAKSTGGISFSVPAQLRQGVSMPPDDLGEVSQYYTYIETPGVYIRIGHADPRRRAGPYATGPWPARQAAAALNLEFATREAIGALQLAKSLPRLGIATIMLMNFDTNYPTLGPDEAHEDWPPHWHMHLFWNDVPKVRKVAHFYLSEGALLTGDYSSDLKGSSFTDRSKLWYRNGVPNETRTPSGELVYAQTITPEGFFKLATSNGSCLIRPVGPGFDTGAAVACDKGSRNVRVRAVDDPVAGRLMLYLNGKPATEYRYDTDTGALTTVRDLAK
jgi:hypothetical protein